MSLRQIHELDKIMKKRQRELKREFIILEIKNTINDKIQLVLDGIVDTFNDIINRFMYEDKTLAYAKRK